MARRTNPAPGIAWLDARKKWKAEVEIGVGSRQERKRKAAYFSRDTPLSTMVAWQEGARVELRAQLDDQRERYAPITKQTISTVADAVAYYIPTITVKNEGSRITDLRAWLHAPTPEGPLGPQRLAALNDYNLTVIWKAWRKVVAVSTLNHRRTALLACLRRAAPDLVAVAQQAIPHTVERLGKPRELQREEVDAILAALPPNSRATAFIRVLAETGMGPETLRRMQPDDVDERRCTMVLTPRQKGGGADGVTLNMTEEAADAFQAYRAAGWRPVVRATIKVVWDRAVAAVRTGSYPRNIPHEARGTLGAPRPIPDCTPYVLRHSFAIRFLDACEGDVTDAMDKLRQYMQHQDLSTTHRYIRARTTRGVASAIAALNAMDKARRAARPVEPDSQSSDHTIPTIAFFGRKNAI
jgi:integrase